MNCLFCQIARKEIPAKIIKETENSLAFLDINPVSPGHCLVIPKKHYADLLELPDDQLLDFFKTVKEVVRLLKDKLNPDGFNIGCNNGRSAGQVIDHLHFNIITRYQNDGGKDIQSIVSNPPKESLEEIYQKLTN